MPEAKWYGVDGDRVIGPFLTLTAVKQGFSIPDSTHNDEKIDFGLYRYGRRFIGTDVALDKANIRKLPKVSTPQNVATHYRIVLGTKESDDWLVKTLRTGEWVSLP